MKRTIFTKVIIIVLVVAGRSDQALAGRNVLADQRQPFCFWKQPMCLVGAKMK